MFNLENKKILVTGAAGFIGSHLCDRLLQEPVEQVVGIDNLFLGKERNLLLSLQDKRFLFEKLDVTDFDKLQALCTDNNFDAIFHLAVIPLPVSLIDPIWCYRQNVLMSENICEIIRLKSKRITLIHYSSSEVYGSALYTPMDEKHPLDSHTPYAASKASADLLTLSYYHTYGIDMAMIRPFNNYGPRQNEGSYAGVIPVTIKRILSEQMPIITGDGKQTRDFIYVGDTANAAIEIYKNEITRGQVYNVASGKQISIKSIIDIICNELKYKSEVLYQPARPGDVLTHEGSITKIKQDLNYSVKVEFEQGIKSTIAWYVDALSK